jgi:hypothetical protein
MLEKLLKNPITIPILKLLALNPLTIPQIATDLQLELLPCIAVMSEMFHFGLVRSTQRPSNEQTLPDRFPLDLTDTSLGLPMSEYLELWEGLQQNSDQVDLEQLKRKVFTVPPHLVTPLKQHESEEIRDLLLSKL